MGCCSARQKAEIPQIFEENCIESISQNQESFKITIQEIHLTRFYEKIVKAPQEYFISITTSSEEHKLPSVNIEGLHYSYENSAEVIIKSYNSSVTFSLCVNKFSHTTIIGTAIIDLDIFKTYKQFKGSIPVMYRCIKTGTIGLEISKFSLDNDYMTLSEQSRSLAGNFFPSKDYPSQYTSVFSPTPKFNTYVSAEPHNINAGIVEKIKLLKKKIVNFEFLIENLEENSPDIIYYTCDRLLFFACQSNYSNQIKISTILNFLSKYCADKLICLKALWLLYYLLENSDTVILI